MTRRRSGSAGRAFARSSRASGSGGIGRRSRAGGDEAALGANVLNEQNLTRCFVLVQTPNHSLVGAARERKKRGIIGKITEESCAQGTVQ